MVEIGAGSLAERSKHSPKWTAEQLWDLLSGIGEPQKKFLEALTKADDLLESDHLIVRMGLDSKAALECVVGGLYMQLKRMSVNPSWVYFTLECSGDIQGRLWGLNARFRIGLMTIGWPDGTGGLISHMKARVVFIVMALSMIGTTAGWAAQDGGALYKAKCASCHGPNGEGKSSLKNSQLKGKNLDVNQVTDNLLRGNQTLRAPHKKGISNLNEDQARALAEFVKTLK